MKKIQILGTGCPKCKALTASVERVVRETGLHAEIENVTKIDDIMKFGIVMTPGLAVDGEVKSAGKVLSAQDIMKLLA